MVAGLAAGAGTVWPNQYAGAAPESDIVSIRTANANTESLVSDVVAGAQWVLANKDAYGIRVVNLSLLSGSPSSFVNDPLGVRMIIAALFLQVIGTLAIRRIVNVEF